MSIRFELDNAPEFYTNLDTITGQVVLQLNRPEQVGTIVVKLEGEAITGVHQDPSGGAREGPSRGHTTSGNNSPLFTEKHKVLYKIQQVFPDDYHSSMSSPYGAFPLQVGRHTFPFKFKLPINNFCSDPQAMAALGMAALTGNGLFGSKVRLMDGTKQLYLPHVTQTLPPSFTNFFNEAEIRYYLKATVQRPGFLKENWRHMRQFKFMPIEPPRQNPKGQEAFARRPFTFKRNGSEQSKKKNGFLGIKKGSNKEMEAAAESSRDQVPPQSIEISARLPHPPILTCNKPVPLRLVAKRLVNNTEQVYLTSLQMELIGMTTLRAQNNTSQRETTWIVVSNPKMEQPILSTPIKDVGTEITIPDEIWSRKPLPNTIAPSFVSCNVIRRYQLKITIGLRLGKSGFAVKSVPETVVLPLNFPKVEVYSGLPPPRELLAGVQGSNAANNQAASSGHSNNTPAAPTPPARPPRPQNATMNTAPQAQGPPLPARQSADPLYPPQLQPGETGHEDAPPSYSEALADGASAMFDSQHPRPPFSGVTDENAPSAFPQEKN